MDWFTGIIVFLLIWWTVIFTVLPWGLEREPDGTPRITHLKRKLAITTLISVLLWAMLYALMAADIISFRDMARSMAIE